MRCLTLAVEELERSLVFDDRVISEVAGIVPPAISAVTAAAITVFVPFAWTEDVASFTTIRAPRALLKTTLNVEFITISSCMSRILNVSIGCDEYAVHSFGSAHTTLQYG